MVSRRTCARERRIGGETAVEALHDRLGERTAGRLGAGGVDEGDDGEAVALQRGEAGRRAAAVEQRVVVDAVDHRQRVRARRRRLVLRREGADGVGVRDVVRMRRRGARRRSAALRRTPARREARSAAAASAAARRRLIPRARPRAGARRRRCRSGSCRTGPGRSACGAGGRASPCRKSTAKSGVELLAVPAVGLEELLVVLAGLVPVGEQRGA